MFLMAYGLGAGIRLLDTVHEAPSFSASQSIVPEVDIAPASGPAGINPAGSPIIIMPDPDCIIVPFIALGSNAEDADVTTVIEFVVSCVVGFVSAAFAGFVVAINPPTIAARVATITSVNAVNFFSIFSTSCLVKNQLREMRIKPFFQIYTTRTPIAHQNLTKSSPKVEFATLYSCQY